MSAMDKRAGESPPELLDGSWLEDRHRSSTLQLRHHPQNARHLHLPPDPVGSKTRTVANLRSTRIIRTAVSSPRPPRPARISRRSHRHRVRNPRRDRPLRTHRQRSITRTTPSFRRCPQTSNLWSPDDRHDRAGGGAYRWCQRLRRFSSRDGQPIEGYAGKAQRDWVGINDRRFRCAGVDKNPTKMQFVDDVVATLSEQQR